MLVPSKTIAMQFEAEHGGYGAVCDYVFTPAGTQARFAGREAMVPDVDLKDYRVEAVFDWIKLALELEDPTQFRFVQDELLRTHGKKLFVTPPKYSAGGASQHFTITFQDPDRDLVEDSIRDIDHRWGIDGPVTIAGVEISVDLYPRSTLDEDRWRMVGLLQRHFLPLREMKLIDQQCRRESNLIERSKVLLDHINLRWSVGRTQGLRQLGAGGLYLDGTTYFRPRGSSPSWRAMDKVSNQRIGSVAEQLKQKEKRARIEVTLEGAALLELEVTTLADLVDFKPERLAAGYFTFWTPTFKNIEATGKPTAGSAKRHEDLVKDFARMGVMAMLLDSFQSVGMTRVMKAHTNKAPVRLGASGRLRSWTPLNDAVRRALMKLRF